MTEPLIRVEHLSRYYGPHRALDDLDLEIHKGEVVGLLGLNGAGKSTTFKLISGNLAPSTGRILIGGLDLVRHPRPARARLGYLPDQPPLYRELTVDEYLAYAARLHGLSRARVGSAVREARRRCGLDNRGHQLIGTLSRGYQQRLGIAQALVHGPDAILLDEPTTGLDPAQIREIRSLITELGRDHAILLSSHILPEVEATCSRVLILHGGRLAYAADLNSLREQVRGDLQIRLRRPPPVVELGAISGVDRVTDLGGGVFRLDARANSPIADAVVGACAAHDWGLTELTEARNRLEEVFIALTCGDSAADPEQAA